MAFTAPIVLGALGAVGLGVGAHQLGQGNERVVHKPAIDPYMKVRELARKFSAHSVDKGLVNALHQLQSDSSIDDSEKRLLLRLASSEFSWRKPVKDRLNYIANAENLGESLSRATGSKAAPAPQWVDVPSDLDKYNFMSVTLRHTTRQGRGETEPSFAQQIKSQTSGKRYNADYDYDQDNPQSASANAEKDLRNVKRASTEFHKAQMESALPETTEPVLTNTNIQRSDPANMASTNDPSINNSQPTVAPPSQDNVSQSPSENVSAPSSQPTLQRLYGGVSGIIQSATRLSDVDYKNQYGLLEQPKSEDRLAAVQGRSNVYTVSYIADGQEKSATFFNKQQLDDWKRLHEQQADYRTIIARPQAYSWDAYSKRFPDEARDISNQVTPTQPQPTQSGQPIISPQATQPRTDEPEMFIRTDITPMLNLPRVISSAVLDSTLYAGGALATIAATQIGGPVAGRVINGALANAFNVWSQVNRARGYSEAFGSQLAAQFQRNLIQGERLVHPESAAANILNPLLTATDSQRTSVPLQEAFVRQLARGNNVDLGRRDWMNYYQDLTSPFAV
jgi:hypothetical protein